MAIQRLGSSGTTWVISDAFVLNREKWLAFRLQGRVYRGICQRGLLVALAGLCIGYQGAPTATGRVPWLCGLISRPSPMPSA